MHLILAFKYAIHGIMKAFKSEKSIRIILACFLLAVAGGIILNLSAIEWCVVLICSSVMFTAEMINTVIECIVDMITKEYSSMAEKAKDMAAGATLIVVVFSLAVGIIIYLPHVLKLLGLGWAVQK